jgi:flagellar biosynthetic protein FliR
LLSLTTFFLSAVRVIFSYAEFNSDYTQSIIQIVNEVWIIIIKMASSFIIISLLINIGSSVLSRLMPQLHIFFLIIPIQSLIGFLFLSITISILMIWFIETYKSYINNLFI